jgi:hypothetical protein
MLVDTKETGVGAPPKRAASALPPFPAPFMVHGVRFWRRGDIRRYQAAVAGHPYIERESDDEWMQATEVRLALGGVSDMWIHRRLRETRAASTSSAA